MLSRLLFVGSIVANAAVTAKLDLDRCADAKVQNDKTLTIVALVSSHARDLNLRSELRRTQFQQARSLVSRTVFRPSNTSTGAIPINEIRDDGRSVCVQPLFVLSPWHEVSVGGMSVEERDHVVKQQLWRTLIAESKAHKDVLIAPTIIGTNTRARELMFLLDWSRQRVPWADYIVSLKTNVHIHWEEMIKIFPPPVPQQRSSNKLWQLGSSYSSMDALFFKDHNSAWQQCPDVGVAAFSRDLVRQMTDMPFAKQILYAFRHPFRMHQAHCKKIFWNKRANIHDELALSLDDLIDLPRGENFPGNKASFHVISGNKACQRNNEGIEAYHHERMMNFDHCKSKCRRDGYCRSIDWFKTTKRCNLYKHPCKTPLEQNNRPVSLILYEQKCAQAGSGDGMMGILGNPDKYVCNAVQTVLSHLSNVSSMTFHTTLVSKEDQRFWQKGNRARRLSEQSKIEQPSKDQDSTNARRKGQVLRRTGVTGQLEVQKNDRRKEEQANAVHSRYNNVLANISSQQPSRHRRRESSSSGAKSYTIPAHARPGNRCASAKRDLGDDLLTVVALVPIGPFNFTTRKYLRKFLTGRAHKLRSRQFYRKIKTLSSPRRQPLFDQYRLKQAFINESFGDMVHVNYTDYQWEWLEKSVGEPVEDMRAVCVEVLFAVGLTKLPVEGDDQKLERLALETHEHNDIIIGPYLDGRGKGIAMTQKTVSLLWWSSVHLSWADHVFKADTDTFINFTRLVQVLPPPSQSASLQTLGALHGRWWMAGYGPACFNGELYGFSQPLLQLIGPLIETPAHVDFFLENPIHIMPHIGMIGMKEAIPYSLRFPEDLVACSLVAQAVIGHEGRFDDHVLERPDYFPMWAHKLKNEKEYEACATGKCHGWPPGRGANKMPKFSEVSAIPLDLYHQDGSHIIFDDWQT